MAAITDPNQVRLCEYLVLRNQLRIVDVIELDGGATIMVQGSVADSEGTDYEFTTTKPHVVTRARQSLTRPVHDVPAGPVAALHLIGNPGPFAADGIAKGSGPEG